jgi:hypothetical protein
VFYFQKCAFAKFNIVWHGSIIWRNKMLKTNLTHCWKREISLLPLLRHIPNEQNPKRQLLQPQIDGGSGHILILHHESLLAGIQTCPFLIFPLLQPLQHFGSPCFAVSSANISVEAGIECNFCPVLIYHTLHNVLCLYELTHVMTHWLRAHHEITISCIPSLRCESYCKDADPPHILCLTFQQRTKRSYNHHSLLALLQGLEILDMIE